MSIRQQQQQKQQQTRRQLNNKLITKSLKLRILASEQILVSTLTFSDRMLFFPWIRKSSLKPAWVWKQRVAYQKK